MSIALETADQPEVIALIDQLDRYQQPLYPAESHHGIPISALRGPNVLFAVVRDPQGRAIGCGAIVLHADYGEVKRMFVLPAQRGEGIGRTLLAFLEQQAIALGCRRFALETGIRQPEAIALYERCGYVRTAPFGAYRPDPLSLFLQKRVVLPTEQAEPSA